VEAVAVANDEGLDDADQDAAEGGAGDIANAASTAATKALMPGWRPMRDRCWAADGDEDAGGSRERRAEAEGEGDNNVVIDAHEGGGDGLTDRARMAMPSLVFGHDETEGDQQKERDGEDEDLADHDGEVREGPHHAGIVIA